MLFICNLIFLNDQNQEELQRNWKKVSGNQEKLKSKENPWSAKFRSLKRAPAKMALGCEMILQPQGLAVKMPLGCEMISQPHTPLCENFCSYETPLWHTSAILQTPPLISQLRNALRNPPRLKIPIFAAAPLFRKWFHSCETAPWHTSAISQPSTLILQLRNGLWKYPFAVKSAPCCEIDHLLRK